MGPQLVSKKHSKFYFNDLLITIQVEDTLFNVHKSQLLRSETFQDMFAIRDVAFGGFNHEHSFEDEGSENNPLKLSGVCADDFEKLLTMLYTSYYSHERPAEDPSLLIPALRLADMYNFGELRQMLIPLAEKALNDVDRIVCARDFGITEWLADAHVGLCVREEPLNREEARKVGLDSVWIISHLREKSRIAHTVVKGVQIVSSFSGGRLHVDRPFYTPDALYFQKGIKAWLEGKFEDID